MLMTTSHALDDTPGTDELSPETPSWYVIQTKPRQEERAKANIEALCIETFFPKILDRRINEFTGAVTSITKALFSQYIFARFSANQLINRIGFARGVNRVVSFGDSPCQVDQEIIRTLRAQVSADGFVRLNDDLKPGDRVVIQDGRLAHLGGIFERDLTDCERVSILLTTLSYQARIVVNKGLVRKVA